MKAVPRQKMAKIVQSEKVTIFDCVWRECFPKLRSG